MTKTKVEKLWYAIRVTYNRELKVKADLQQKEIECFLPMTYKDTMKGEQKVRQLVPAIHNLIFIRLSEDDMKEYKRTTSLPIRYIMDGQSGRPLTVPEREMQNFIHVAGVSGEPIVYLDLDTANMKRGDRVRITGGLFEGTEGEFVRVRGDRRVMVRIAGLVAVATPFIHPSLIERIES